MGIFDIIGFRNTGNICQKCAHFQNQPSVIEQTYPGLTSMSSGYASVRDRDGLCSINNIYLSAGDTCRHFTLANQPGK
ncbi:hypothetical protein [Mucilaginibacter antarcticus]|uniref:Uncharacterized protein n=1 Tax=Mucilaginibacter antarcticus TaxID=1855725 RepID=A0ABW5XS22_9SPHI